MIGRSRNRSDLVIGMTLAEVFLLLLIVGWYGSRLESESFGTGADPVDIVSPKEHEELKKLVEKLEQDLTAARRDNSQLEQILDWIAKTAGLPGSIRNIEDAKRALDRISFEAKRGRPVCRDNNVLVDVVVDRGQVIATIRQSVPELTPYESGRKLRTRSELDVFLARVDAYYAANRATTGSNCVFDFSLTWSTDSDYRSGREVFESHFYPARIRQSK